MNIDNAKKFIKLVYLIDDVNDEQALKLQGLLQDLSDREERVIRMRYGLDDGRERSLREISDDFGITAERIRQIASKAIKKLRHPVRSRILFGEDNQEAQKEYTPQMNLMDSELSIRAKNCLKRAGIDTFEKLLNIKLVKLYNIKNLGKKAMLEIVEFIWKHGELCR